jgi:outer membrane protein
MKIVRVFALLGVASTGAMAQATPPSGDSPTEDGPPLRWGLGVGAIVQNARYAGEGTRVQPVPLISYEGEHFFFRGITAGWQFFENETFELAAIAQFRFDGFEIKELGRRELAANGLDSRLLEDRDDSVDAGISASWSGSAGELELELLADVTGKSKGQEFSVQYGYPLDLGRTVITPNIGVTYLSKDMANYYYGTLDSEVRRGVIDYKPGAATLPYVGVNVMHSFADNWTFVAFLEYSVLPNKITDSPLLERNTKGAAEIIIGVQRAF